MPAKPSFVLFHAPQPGRPDGVTYMGYVQLLTGEYLKIEARVVPEANGVKKHFEGTAYDPIPAPTAKQTQQQSLMDAINKYGHGKIIDDDWPQDLVKELGAC